MSRLATLLLPCALAALLPAGLFAGESSSGGGGYGPAFANPPEARSHGGKLQLTLEAKESIVQVGGKSVRTIVYNGQYVPPTLHLRQGDIAEIRLVNHCERPTNLHFHGMSVSPMGNGDNMMVKVDPGSEFTYRFQVPKDHPEGLFWYHSHATGAALPQVMRGMSGAILIDGMLQASYPQLKGVKQQIMVLKDLELDWFGRIPQAITANLTSIRTVNGLVNPRLTMRPGEIQLWSLSNQSGNLFFRLRLDGETFHIVAEDGHATTRMIPTTEYLLGPSSRVEFLVRCDQPGVHKLTTGAVRTGPTGDGYPAADLVTLVCEGPRLASQSLPLEASCCAPTGEDLKGHRIDQKRLFVFSDGNSDFRINGRTFDHNRLDTRVPLGTVEEWTLRNSSDELHHFHLHQVPFQVVEINGKPVPFTGYRDTVPMPNRGNVKIIVPFTDPHIVGNFMYHCHIMEHEDGGMMGTIQVYDPSKPDGGLSGKGMHPVADATAKGGRFQLTTSAGQKWSPGDASEKIDLLAFGYTHCKDACPLTLQKMHSALTALGKSANKVQPVLVTVDPERDTPAVLAEYERETGFPVTTLTGSDEAVAQVARDYGVTIRKEESSDGANYRVRHSTEIFAVSPKGQIVARFSATDSAEQIAAGLNAQLTQLSFAKTDYAQ